MPNIKILHLLSDDKDIAAMQQPETLLVPSKSDSPDSSLSPMHQEDQFNRQQSHQEQEREREREQEQEQVQEKLRDGWSKKRKRECDDDEASREETPRKSSIRCYYPPRPPRKPKASPAMKRRAMWVKRSVVFLDVATEVESMFPPSVLRDFGKKIKKAIS